MAEKTFEVSKFAECVKVLATALEGFMNAPAADGKVTCDAAPARKAARDLLDMVGTEETDDVEPAPNEGEAVVPRAQDAKGRVRAAPLDPKNPLSPAYGLSKVPTKPGAARPVALDSIFGAEATSSGGTTLGDIFGS